MIPCAHSKVIVQDPRHENVDIPIAHNTYFMVIDESFRHDAQGFVFQNEKFFFATLCLFVRVIQSTQFCSEPVGWEWNGCEKNKGKESMNE
jgi:hypothetical protein